MSPALGPGFAVVVGIHRGIGSWSKNVEGEGAAEEVYLAMYCLSALRNISESFRLIVLQNC